MVWLSPQCEQAVQTSRLLAREDDPQTSALSYEVDLPYSKRQELLCWHTHVSKQFESNDFQRNDFHQCWCQTVGQRFAAALWLPRLFGTYPRSHHKGATGRVWTGDQWLPVTVLCHCQLGQDIPSSNFIMHCIYVDDMEHILLHSKTQNKQLME